MQFPGQGVECCKQLIGSVGAGACEGVEQRAFAGVGVADQRNRKRPLPQSLATASQALAFSAIDQHTQLTNLVVEHAPVKFDLLFTGPPAQTNAALLSLKVRPSANKSGGLMLHLGKFHLKLTFVATSPLGENLENQADPLHNVDAPDLFEVALLDGRQGMIEQHVINLLGDEALANFGDFPATNKGRRIGAGPMDRDPSANGNPRRTGQRSEFVQRTLVTSNAADPDANQKRPAIFVRQVQVASLSCWKFTGRAGTTVEIACL